MNSSNAVVVTERADSMSTQQSAVAIGVFGGASQYTEAQAAAAFQIGRTIAQAGFYLVTGATTGIPLAAAIGAQSAGGLVIGISPAESPETHVTRFQRPVSYHDALIYTGMGVEGRQPVAIRSVKGAIFIGGEFGTLAEFSNAWTVGNNVLGVLKGIGGISDRIESIVAGTVSNYGSILIVDDDPLKLATSVCAATKERYSGTRYIEQETSDVQNLLAVLNAAGLWEGANG
jgi:uncharacterized protein (TIGR00725 family)